jgi:hypothetical protein
MRPVPLNPMGKRKRRKPGGLRREIFPGCGCLHKGGSRVTRDVTSYDYGPRS